VKQVNNTENLKILKDIVGTEQFRIIIERLNGEHIYISNYGGFHSKEERNTSIKSDFFHGLSVPELAEKYNMSVHSIYKITEDKG
jgi:Mor family transcriptional regulator